MKRKKFYVFLVTNYAVTCYYFFFKKNGPKTITEEMVIRTG